MEDYFSVDEEITICFKQWVPKLTNWNLELGGVSYLDILGNYGNWPLNQPWAYTPVTVAREKRSKYFTTDQIYLE